MNDSKLAKVCSTDSAIVGSQGNSPSAAISLLHRNCTLRTWQFQTATPCLDLQQTSQTATPELQQTLPPFFFPVVNACVTSLSAVLNSLACLFSSPLLVVFHFLGYHNHNYIETFWAGFIFQNGNKSLNFNLLYIILTSGIVQFSGSPHTVCFLALENYM